METIPTPQENPHQNVQTQQVAPQQQYAPYVHTNQPQRMPSPFESMVRSNTFLTMIFLGMLFLFLGMLMFAILPEISSDAMKHVLTLGYIFSSLGMFLLSTFLLLAAVIRKEMDKYVRVILVIAAIALIFIWAAYLNLVTPIIQNFYSSSGRYY